MKQLNTLLQKEVSRKQFVVSLMAAVFGLTGLPGLLGLFSKNIQESDTKRPGYGKQGYGP